MKMNENSPFYQQSRFLVDILPYVGKEKCFALKGGTAINFFFQDLPRLSVDIDLTFLPLLSREETLKAIKIAINNIGKRLQSRFSGAHIFMDELAAIPKLVIGYNNVRVKLEVSAIFRGSVFPCQELIIHEKVQQLFGRFVQIPVVSFEDVYAGKFCAALSRQHPRDLFDVKRFFEKQSITDPLRQAFIVYLASDRRPMHELLSPNIKPKEAQKQLFDKEFKGMIDEPLEYDDLSNVVEHLSFELRKKLTIDEQQFLLSLSAGEPEWDRMSFAHLKDLPSLQWKLLNIKKMDSKKQKEAYAALEKNFNL